jgi:hypothetical protein
MAPQPKQEFESIPVHQINEHNIPLRAFMPKKLDLKEDFRMSIDKKQLRGMPSSNFSFTNQQLSRWTFGSSSPKVNLTKHIQQKKSNIPQISEIIQNMRQNDTELSSFSSNRNSRRNQFEKMVEQLPVIEGLGQSKTPSPKLHLDLKEPKLGEFPHSKKLGTVEKIVQKQGGLVSSKNSYKNGSFRSVKPVSIFGEDDMTNFSSKFTFDKN